jgi:hypothetical protein
MANSFDYPNGALVDDAGSVTPVWDQWFARIQAICSASQQSGVTANRPTSNLWIGRRYYDTTLNLPVYVASVRPTVWRNAAGVIA